jgi:hypothetical protein
VIASFSIVGPWVIEFLHDALVVVMVMGGRLIGLRVVELSHKSAHVGSDAHVDND